MQFNNEGIAHDIDSLSVSRHLSLFLRTQLLRNYHFFPTYKEMEAAMVENLPMKNVWAGTPNVRGIDYSGDGKYYFFVVVVCA